MVIEKRWNFNENGFIAVVIQGFNSPTRTQGETPENVEIPTFRGFLISNGLAEIQRKIQQSKNNTAELH